MKNYSKVMMIAVVAILFGVQSANADNKLKDLLGKSSKLGGVVSNVLGSSKVKVSDLQGSWTTTSPAVIFRSDDLLEKAVMKARQLNASYHVGNVLSSDIFSALSKLSSPFTSEDNLRPRQWLQIFPSVSSRSSFAFKIAN